jgi:hypothetical protein
MITSLFRYYEDSLHKENKSATLKFRIFIDNIKKITQSCYRWVGEINICNEECEASY